MSYQFAHLFIYRGKIHTSQKTMYFYTDHDMSRGDKSVSTLVSLLAFSVCVCPCVSPPITTYQTCHPRWALPVRTFCILVRVYMNTFCFILTIFPFLILPRSMACMCCYCSLIWCVLGLRLATHSTWILIQPACSSALSLCIKPGIDYF